jgi:hypothetical protein
MSDDDPVVLRVHLREAQSVTLSIPTKVLTAIDEVAESRDMSPEALMKLYIGHGLRQDLARLASENDTRHPNATTLRVLEDAQARDRLASFASPDELFEDLGTADPETADG